MRKDRAIDRFDISYTRHSAVLSEYDFLCDSRSSDIVYRINQFKSKLEENRSKDNDDRIIEITENMARFLALKKEQSAILFKMHYKTDEQIQEYLYLRSISIYLFQLAYNYTSDYEKSAKLVVEEVAKLNDAGLIDYYLEFAFLDQLDHLSGKLYAYLYQLMKGKDDNPINVEEIDPLIHYTDITPISNLFLVRKMYVPEDLLKQFGVEFANRFNSLQKRLNQPELMRYDKTLLSKYHRIPANNILHLLSHPPKFVIKKEEEEKSEFPIKFFKSRISIEFRTKSDTNLTILTYFVINILAQFGDITETESLDKLFRSMHKIKAEFVKNEILFAFQPRSVTIDEEKVFARQFYLVNFDLNKYGSLFRNFKYLYNYMSSLYTKVRIKLTHFAFQMEPDQSFQKMYERSAQILGEYSKIMTPRYFVDDYRKSPVKINLLQSGHLQFHISRWLCNQIRKEIYTTPDPRAYLLDLVKNHCIKTLEKWLDRIDIKPDDVINAVEQQFQKSINLSN